MKNRGLQNRFPPEVRQTWEAMNWTECGVCEMNGCDVLHHIISPTVRYYVGGTHNESIFNSCPIHNQLHPSAFQFAKQGMSGFGITKSCHIGNDTYLHRDDILKKLLWRTAEALDGYGYVATKNDKEFLRVYGFLYSGKIKLWEARNKHQKAPF